MTVETVSEGAPATLTPVPLETPLPSPVSSPTLSQTSDTTVQAFPILSSIPSHLQRPTVTTTLHSFPKLEPLHFVEYPHDHLGLPLRKDILHRAVVYEGDNTRQGTAATKHRFEIAGSKRKLRPQKGTGRARLGDRSSPMLRGGGRAFDKKARDFGTGLPRKLYDVAWRTALSYRYAQGELVVVDTLALEEGEELAQNVSFAKSWIEQVFPRLGWAKSGGGSLLLGANSTDRLHTQTIAGLTEGLRETRGWGRGMTVSRRCPLIMRLECTVTDRTRWTT